MPCEKIRVQLYLVLRIIQNGSDIGRTFSEDATDQSYQRWPRAVVRVNQVRNSRFIMYIDKEFEIEFFLCGILCKRRVKAVRSDALDDRK